MNISHHIAEYDHMVVSLFNQPVGSKTMVVCSCGWQSPFAHASLIKWLDHAIGWGHYDPDWAKAINEKSLVMAV